MSESAPEVTIPAQAIQDMSRHAFACFPEECCGLLVGDRATATAVRFVPVTNAAHSARVYTIEPKEHLKAELAAEAEAQAKAAEQAQAGAGSGAASSDA